MGLQYFDRNSVSRCRLRVANAAASGSLPPAAGGGERGRALWGVAKTACVIPKGARRGRTI